MDFTYYTGVEIHNYLGRIVQEKHYIGLLRFLICRQNQGELQRDLKRKGEGYEFSSNNCSYQKFT